MAATVVILLLGVLPQQLVAVAVVVCQLSVKTEVLAAEEMEMAQPPLVLALLVKVMLVAPEQAALEVVVGALLPLDQTLLAH